MFAQLSYAERVYDVENALSSLLPILHAPAPTRVVAEKLARHLGAPVDEVARILLKLAPKHAHATHNGRVQMRFGRSMTGWLWHPRPQGECSLADRLPPLSEELDAGPFMSGDEVRQCSRCELEPANPKHSLGWCDSCIRDVVARDLHA
jgi:hypothetical protein